MMYIIPELFPGNGFGGSVTTFGGSVTTGLVVPGTSVVVTGFITGSSEILHWSVHVYM